MKEQVQGNGLEIRGGEEQSEINMDSETILNQDIKPIWTVLES